MSQAWAETGYDPELAREAMLRRRPREARHADGPTYQAPNVVAMAKCLAHPTGCKELVAVTDEGMDGITTFSAQLERKGDKPLDMNAIFPCATCRAAREAAWTANTAKRRERTTEAVRYCKNANESDLVEGWRCVQAGLAGKMPPDTRQGVIAAMERTEWLRRVMGVGYVNDLLVCLKERESSGKRGKPRKEDL